MSSYFSAATISSLRPRASSCGHVLPSAARVTRSRSGASRLSQQQQQRQQQHRQHQVSAGPSLCGLCHQRLVLARRFDRQTTLLARRNASLLPGERPRKRDVIRRNRARAALSNWEIRIELWEEEHQHQHQHQSLPPSAAGRHDSAVAISPSPPSPPGPSSSFSSPSSPPPPSPSSSFSSPSSPPPPSPSSSHSPSAASSSSSSDSSSSQTRRAAFDPAQQHRAPSSYRSGKLGRRSLARSSQIYRPGRHAPDPEAVEDTSFRSWTWNEYDEEMWWRRAEERFGREVDWHPWVWEMLQEMFNEWWDGGRNMLDELDEEDRMHEEEEEDEEEEEGEEGEEEEEW